MARGRITIDVERCKGCELCTVACSHDVIVISDELNSHGYYPALLLDPEHKCTGCALCAVVCPDSCITVFRELAHTQRRTTRAG